MKLGIRFLVVLSLVVPGVAAGKECRGLDRVQTGEAKSVVASLIAAVRQNASDVADCGSLASVAARLARQGRAGGRQLEKDRPLNVAEAQAELQAASRQSAVRAQLDQVSQEASDANLRLMYEAAVLDQHGFYKARDLKIQELLRRAE
jgi:hypothetical protein